MTELTSIMTSWLVFYVIWYVLNAYGYMGQFRKAGMPKALAFIPFLREVQIYKMSWQKKNMGLAWLISTVGGIVLLFVGANTGVQILAWVGFILLIASVVLQIIRDVKQAKAFNCGGGMIASLILVNPIANVVLARNTADYKGAR